MQDILTEKEAKTRFCPYRFTTQIQQSFSRDGGATSIAMPPIKCIATECMAWRCAHKDAADGEERGYCGAFGLPRFT